MTSERRSPFQKYNDRIKSLEGELEKRDKDIKELQERLNKLEKISIAQAPAKAPKRGTAKGAKPKPQTAAPTAALKAKKVPPRDAVPVAEEVAIPSDNLCIDEKKPEMVKSAFKRTQKRYKLKSTYINSPLSELTMNKKAIENVLKENLKEMRSLKFNRGMDIRFEKIKEDYPVRAGAAPLVSKETLNQVLWSSPQILTDESQIDKTMQLAGDTLITRAHNFLRQGSNWQILSVNFQYIDILLYNPLEGSSYIELSKELQNPRKGLINIKNEDQKCFLYCLLYHFHKDEMANNPQRVSKYKRYEGSVSLNFNGINFPVAIKDIPKIEKMNNISVNVFGYESKRTFPLYLSNPPPVGRVAETINLLLISDDNNQHYVYIKDFNRFMTNISKHKGKKHFCMPCLQHFSSEEILNEHRTSCLKINKKQNIIMPKFGSKAIFKNYFKMLRCPFIIYCDFESILEPVSSAKLDEQSASYSEGYQHHKICSYAYKVHCQVDKYSKSVRLYRGENAAENFLRNLLKENEKIQKIIKTQFHERMKITQEQEREFKRSTKCYICEKKFTKKSIKVRDHCHITGKYRGPAHKNCNLQLVISNKVPVVFHNLRGYDSHFIMQEIGKFNLNIEVIPTNSEKYLSFTWGQNLVFIDSFQFMASSLDKLASNLPVNKFINLEKEFNEDKVSLLKRKGVYCYEYTDSWEKFQEVQFPDKEKFYSSLNNTNVSTEEYERALKIYSEFNCNSLRV